MNIPDELRYSSDHEWARAEGNLVRVGITDYAQDSLGDVVYVQVPDLDAEVTAGAALGEVESTKSVSDLFAPVSGRVVEVNTVLENTPELLNSDPYGEGWICVIEVASPSDLEALLTAEGYSALIAD
jgi:glycine cleavage system H protein